MNVIKVPGKLVLLGEYAVLEKNIPAVSCAINKYIYLLIEENEKIIFTSKRIGVSKIELKYNSNKIILEKENKILNFVKNSIEITLKYLKENSYKIKFFNINILSDLNDNQGNKYGFGSSSAVCVATVSSILFLHGYDIKDYKNREIIFKLSSIAHFISQGSGSGIDIASSVFGGLFIYKSYNQDWLNEKLKKLQNISILVNDKWEYFYYEKINLLIDFYISLFWTGYSVNTSHFIEKIKDFKEKDFNKEFYNKFINSMNKIVESFKYGIRNNKRELINKSIDINRKLLLELSEKACLDLETDKIKKFIRLSNKLGYSAKFSGSGGGDCVFAIVYDKESDKKLKKIMKSLELIPIDIEIDFEGVININSFN
ncbi:MAG: phosphomevalonate kinase [Candidatus Sericytochromatia bacterium]|nr:MAG: phosphomevalonate kinase [Candidatus Sericytochromatia bacterium]